MHLMELPREVLLGENLKDKVSQVAKRLKLGEKALILYGPKTKEIAGKDVEKHLKDFFEVEGLIVKEASMKEEIGRAHV